MTTTARRLRDTIEIYICPDRLDDAALDRTIHVRWLTSPDAAPKPTDV